MFRGVNHFPKLWEQTYTPQKTLEKYINARRDKNVTIEAHQTTRYELFAKVLDISRLAGAEGFSIIK